MGNQLHSSGVWMQLVADRSFCLVDKQKSECSIQNWISLCDFDCSIPPGFTSNKRYLLKSSFLHNKQTICHHSM